jgi:hypothetical protein
MLGQRPRLFETRNRRDCRVRSNVEKHPLTDQLPCAAVIKVYFQRLWGNEASTAHNQFGTTRAVVLQVQFDLAIDHIALALTHRGHIGLDRTCNGAELPSVPGQVRNPCTPNLVLAGHAGNVGTGTADPAALDDGGTSP